MNTWLTMTASDLGRGIASGEIDPVALAECYLDAIDAHEFRDRIYARTTPERARAEAEAARERARQGQRLSPLDGVPISWKDLYDTAGIATEAGSDLLAGRVPDRDARVLRVATRAGLVCLGKTHMSELAFSGLGYNPKTATSPCVNDHAAVAGGSSSGAATSVAFGLAAAGIGSDTGGSVRAPASWNDLVGLKTTAGRLSLEGVVPLIASLDTVGPLTRSVEDAAELLAAMEGRKAADLRGASLKGRRLGVLQTVAMDDLDDAPAAALQSAIARFEAAGAIVEPFEFPAVKDAMALSPVLYSGEGHGTWRDQLKANPEKVFHQIRERLELGESFSAPDFVAAWQKLEDIRTAYLRATAGFDAILLASTPILPPSLARLESDPEYYKKVNLAALRNTRIGNLLGECGLTLPTSTPSCGVMLMARPNSEESLLRLGAAAEKALS